MTARHKLLGVKIVKRKVFPRYSMRRKLVLLGVLVAFLILFMGTWTAGSILTAPAAQSIGDLPSDLIGRRVQFPSQSGATIHGWLLPGQKDKGAVALMHGVRSNRLSMLGRARF